jgi:hypothetical protein
VDFTGQIQGFGVWAVGTWLAYALARRATSAPPAHKLPHPKVPQVVALGWTVMASLLLVPVGFFVAWYYEFTHSRS